MSCSVCAGYSTYNCPCCGEEVKMVTCPDCEKGFVYYAFDVLSRKMVRVTELAFQILPFDEDDALYSKKRYCQGCVEVCSSCKGEGEIPENY